MGRRRYPRFGYARPYTGPRQTCAGCHKPATQTVCMQETFLRGEDEDYRVCDRHARMAADNMNRFYSHVGSVDRWRQEKAGG